MGRDCLWGFTLVGLNGYRGRKELNLFVFQGFELSETSSTTLGTPAPETMSTAGLPLIVQGDMTVLLEVVHPLHDEARDAIAAFIELVKSPEHVHTYGISHLSL